LRSVGNVERRSAGDGVAIFQFWSFRDPNEISIYLSPSRPPDLMAARNRS